MLRFSQQNQSIENVRSLKKGVPYRTRPYFLGIFSEFFGLTKASYVIGTSDLGEMAIDFFDNQNGWDPIGMRLPYYGIKGHRIMNSWFCPVWNWSCWNIVYMYADLHPKCGCNGDLTMMGLMVIWQTEMVSYLENGQMCLSTNLPTWMHMGDEYWTYLGHVMELL